MEHYQNETNLELHSLPRNMASRKDTFPLADDAKFQTNQVLVSKIEHRQRYARTKHDECHKMDIEERSWTFLTKMSSKRHAVAAVEVNEKLFVVGGYNGDDFLSSTEFISSEGMVKAGPNLPSPRSSHCMTKLPSGNIIII